MTYLFKVHFCTEVYDVAFPWTGAVAGHNPSKATQSTTPYQQLQTKARHTEPFQEQPEQLPKPKSCFQASECNVITRATAEGSCLSALTNCFKQTVPPSEGQSEGTYTQVATSGTPRWGVTRPAAQHHAPRGKECPSGQLGSAALRLSPAAPAAPPACWQGRARG